MRRLVRRQGRVVSASAQLRGLVERGRHGLAEQARGQVERENCRSASRARHPRSPDTLVRFTSNVISALDTHTLEPVDDGASVDVMKLVGETALADDPPTD